METTRRQKKVSRSIKEAVSDAIANHLSDPRIQGFVSVTLVDVSPNLKAADVYLSIFGGDEKSRNKTFMAIEHATPKIQSILAGRLTTRFCPSLHFKIDDNLKKTMETMKIINEVASEFVTDENDDIDEAEEIEEVEENENDNDNQD
ncbi:MAG TPA: 30S ribosome-binding factor RbfA [Sedimentisphaerales bacterium]|nr:30S ribosome-binding factor RbfA [Sedimentisphaerales bacterium]